MVSSWKEDSPSLPPERRETRTRLSECQPAGPVSPAATARVDGSRSSLLAREHEGRPQRFDGRTMAQCFRSWSRCVRRCGSASTSPWSEPKWPHRALGPAAPELFRMLRLTASHHIVGSHQQLNMTRYSKLPRMKVYHDFKSRGNSPNSQVGPPDLPGCPTSRVQNVL